MALKENIVALAARIEASLEIDTNTGIGTEKGKIYEELLPTDLTMATVQAVSEYNTDFIAAGAYAFGQIAVRAMAGNSALKEASCDLQMGAKDTLSLSVDHSRAYRNPQAGADATSTKYGVVTAAYEVRSGKNGGQLKAARAAIAEMAMEALK